MLAWGKWRANRAFITGDLIQSAEYLKSIIRHQQKNDVRLAKKLSRALMARARQAISYRLDLSNIAAAWEDLTSASDIVLPPDEDRLSREKNNLVNATVVAADKCLIAGEVKKAARVIRELQRRKILDTRASKIAKTAMLIQSADHYANVGSMLKAKKCIEQAKDIRPDLNLLDARKKTIEHQLPRMKYLTKQLEFALLAKKQKQIGILAGQLLEIAPKFQIALDARELLLDKVLKQKPQTTNVTNKQGFTALQPASVKPEFPDAAQQPFLLWIDTIGGYFVCPAEKNIIGAAVPHSHVEIPLSGDLNRRHARIDRLNNSHVITPFGETKIDGKQINTETELKSGQTVQLDGGVSLKYVKPSIAGGSARLDYCSRHRTQPWSDGIILCNGLIRIGREPTSDIVCPGWNNDVTIFWRDNKWRCRLAGRFTVDGKPFVDEAEIELNSRIVGSDFSMSFETIKSSG